MENNIPQKINWKSLATVIGLALVQIFLLFLGFVGIFVNGLDTYVPSMTYGGFAFIFFALILPFSAWKDMKRSKSLWMLSLNFLIGIGFILFFFAGPIVLREIRLYKLNKINLPEQSDSSMQSPNNLALKTVILDAKTAYEKIVSEREDVTITGINNQILSTDKDFSIALTVFIPPNETLGPSYTPKFIDYLNKNIIGHQFTVIVPAFDTKMDDQDGNTYTEYALYNSNYGTPHWVCQCDLLVNKKSFVSELGKSIPY